MNIHEAVKEARRYLFATEVILARSKDEQDINKYKLNRNLQYHLCGCFNRLERVHGADNITDKDIHILVESWEMAQGAMGCLPRDEKGNLYYGEKALVYNTNVR